MDKDKLKATIMIQGPSAKVHFEGVWTKRLVDIAHNQMLQCLPGHLAGLREKHKPIIMPKSEPIIEEERT